MAKGSFLIAKAAAAVMIAQGIGGDIVYISSKNSVFAGPNNVAYGAAKADQAHQVRLLAAELGQYGIKVTGSTRTAWSVAPGSSPAAGEPNAPRRPRRRTRRLLRQTHPPRTRSTTRAHRQRRLRPDRRRPHPHHRPAHPRRRRRRSLPTMTSPRSSSALAAVLRVDISNAGGGPGRPWSSVVTVGPLDEVDEALHVGQVRGDSQRDANRSAGGQAHQHQVVVDRAHTPAE
jgi:NAD(P)-dependent dehydrogenase (short-subunit alcohol dehydrogenase family)